MTKNAGLIGFAGCIVAIAALANTASAGSFMSRLVSQSERQASDQQVQQAVSQEEAAQTAINNGNRAVAIQDLQSALADLRQALPIYYGFRGTSARRAVRAMREINEGRPKRASVIIWTAITDAQAGLQLCDGYTSAEDGVE